MSDGLNSFSCRALRRAAGGDAWEVPGVEGTVEGVCRGAGGGAGYSARHRRAAGWRRGGSVNHDFLS